MMRYPVSAPYLCGREAEYIQECLQSNWISSRGRFINRFERGFASFLHREHAITTCNGTSALHLALLGLGVGPGDEVIVPSLTYVATANAVTYCGGTPVFADSDPETWCLSVASVQRLLSPKTKGIIPVHLYGHPCDMSAFADLAQSHGLFVLEDCAQAQGAAWQGRPVGTFGEAAVFSFYGNKVMTTGEGGMVVTDDDQLAKRLRTLRGQGMDPDRHYWHPTVGYNFRMTNVAAAMGLGQLEQLDRLIGDRLRVASWYQERLRDVAGLTLPVEVGPASRICWLYSVLVGSPDCRAALRADLAKAGIETRPFFSPVHTFPMYRHCRTDDGCPVATDLGALGLNLPTSSHLTEEDVDFITAEVCGFMDQAQDHRLSYSLPRAPHAL